MGKNKENDGRQQGPLRHAPEQQGEKTRARQRESAHEGGERAKRGRGPVYDENRIREHSDKGRDRLFEDRQQHDEAEKNSEKTRLARDVDRHDHDSDDELTHRDRVSRAKRKS